MWYAMNIINMSYCKGWGYVTYVVIIWAYTYAIHSNIGRGALHIQYTQYLSGFANYTIV